MTHTRAGRLRRLAGLGPRVWRDLMQAALELAIARLRLGRWTTRELLRAAPNVFRASAAPPVTGQDLRLVRRVAFAIPRVAARLPWRTDCLVQALAGQRWLARKGIPSEISIGVSSTAEDGFLAHAWTKVGDELVTGGDISSYLPMLMPGDLAS